MRLPTKQPARPLGPVWTRHDELGIVRASADSADISREVGAAEQRAHHRMPDSIMASCVPNGGVCELVMLC